MTDPDDDDVLVVISRELRELDDDVQVIKESITGLKKVAVQHGETLDRLTSGPAASIGAGGEDSGRQWWWPAMSDVEAREAWDKLASWVDEELRPRSPKIHRSLKTAKCWVNHPDVVDRLTALLVAWEGAYLPTSLPTARAEWLERWEPATAKALGEILNDCKRGSCDLQEQHDQERR